MYIRYQIFERRLKVDVANHPLMNVSYLLYYLVEKKMAMNYTTVYLIEVVNLKNKKEHIRYIVRARTLSEQITNGPLYLLFPK